MKRRLALAGICVSAALMAVVAVLVAIDTQRFMPILLSYIPLGISIAGFRVYLERTGGLS